MLTIVGGLTEKKHISGLSCDISKAWKSMMKEEQKAAVATSMQTAVEQ